MVNSTPLAEAAQGEKFLVTGSEGCIGAWAVRGLVTAGISTVAVDVTPAGFRLDKLIDRSAYPMLAHEHADLRDEGVLDDIIARHAVTRIVHLAALQVPFVAANPVLGAQVNVVGTVRVFEAVRHSGGQVAGLSFASSAAAVGPEHAPDVPETLYGVFKLSNEHTAGIYARDYGVPSIGLRPCIVYGPARDQGLTSALTSALKAVALGVPFHIPFGGSIDVQYARDVAEAFVRCALVGDPQGAPVFDLHGDAVTVDEFLAVLSQVEPSAAELITHEARQIPGNVIVDDTELVERLGGLPKTSLEDGIRDSLDIFARHRDAGILTPAEISPA